MITVIIPTLLKSNDILLPMLDRLDTCGSVEKIIVIDNTCGTFNKVLPKLTVLNQENLYVNPAWNKGMELCKTPYYLLLNDDVISSTSAIEACLTVCEDFPHINLVTVNTQEVDNSNQVLNYLQSTDMVPYEKPDFIIQGTKHTWYRFQGWFIFGRTSSWEPIPDCLKVFCGDNLIYFRQDTTEERIAYISNYTIYHRVSTTVNSAKRENGHWIGADNIKFRPILEELRAGQSKKGVY